MVNRLLIISLFSILGCKPGSLEIIKDIDGNCYRTLQIGSQVWMIDNLKVSRYRNGDSIPFIINDSLWAGTFSGATTVYMNNYELIKEFGLLYNWYAVSDARNIAPEGWRIPTKDDWEILIGYLGGYNLAGKALKNGAETFWLHKFSDTISNCGFSLMPGGYRNGLNGNFHTMASNGYYWSANESFEFFSWTKRVYSGFANPYREPVNRNFGLSVRCIKE